MPGGGFGALDTMNKTISNNRSLLRTKNLFEVMRDTATAGRKRTHYRYNKLSAAFRKELKLKKVIEKKRKRRLLVAKALLSLAITFMLFHLLFLWINY